MQGDDPASNREMAMCAHTNEDNQSPYKFEKSIFPANKGNMFYHLTFQILKIYTCKRLTDGPP